MRSIGVLFVILISVFSLSGRALIAPYALPPELQKFNWQTGDVVGVSELFSDSSTFFFEAATSSRYGHVGVVSVEERGVYIYEEAPPYAQRTRLDTYLKKAGVSADGRHILASILRPQTPLNPLELSRFLQAARTVVLNKVPYNHTQTMNSKSMNCSEFVHYVFKAAGRKVGKIEKVKDLNLNAFRGAIYELWRRSAGEINPNGLVVTPMSVILSDTLVPVFANAPTDAYIPDYELYKLWKKEKFIRFLAEENSVPESFIDTVGVISSTKPYRALRPRGSRDPR